MALILVLGIGAGLWFGGSWVEQNQWQSKYDTLEEDHQALQVQRDSLQDSYDALRDWYAEIRQTVNLKQGLSDNKMAFVTPDDPTVASTVRTITGGFSEDIGERWADYKAMYDWVRNNIDHSHDSPLPLLPSLTGTDDELSWRQDYWRMPRETLEDKTGDCEDMAVLLASMKTNYSSRTYACWVIAWSSENTGHAAVAFPVEGGRLTILDPAGDYYTNTPYSLGSEGVSAAVDDWLANWPGELGIHVSAVFSDTVYETFSTTNQFVQWVVAEYG